jgi:photosystem II stability/assembly factor-like uncharacterized protein
MKISFSTSCFLLAFYAAAPSLFAQWKAVKPQPTSPNYWCNTLTINPFNPNIAWGTGHAMLSAFQFRYDAPTYFKTTDGGETWQSADLSSIIPSGYVTRFTFADEKNVWAIGLDINANDDVICHSEDAGTTWKKLNYPEFKNDLLVFRGIHFWDKQEGIVWGDVIENGSDIIIMYRTIDGGATWNRVPKDSLPNLNNKEYASTNAFAVRGNYIGFPTTSGISPSDTTGPFRYFYSFNRGRSWSVSNTACQEIAPSFADERNGIIMADSKIIYNNTLLVTSDGGATWTRRPLISGTGVISYAMVPGSRHIIMVIESNITRLFGTMVSTDFGQTWTQIGGVSNLRLTAMDFISPTVGYGLGAQNFRNSEPLHGFRYTGSPLTGLFAGFELKADIQVSPNPVSEQLRVQIDLEHTAPCIVMLHDLEGKLIERQELSQNAQTHTAVFDVQQLPKGTYSVMITTKDGYAVRKVLRL